MCCNKQLTKNKNCWAFYSQLGILNVQLGILHPIGDWGFLSELKKDSENKSPIPNRMKFSQFWI